MRLTLQPTDHVIIEGAGVRGSIIVTNVRSDALHIEGTDHGKYYRIAAYPDCNQSRQPQAKVDFDHIARAVFGLDDNVQPTAIQRVVGKVAHWARYEGIDAAAHRYSVTLDADDRARIRQYVGTGRVSQTKPDIQNFPGTLAHTLEMQFAKTGAPPSHAAEIFAAEPPKMRTSVELGPLAPEVETRLRKALKQPRRDVLMVTEERGIGAIAEELFDMLFDLQLATREGDPRTQELTEQAAELLDRVEAQVKGK